jgi:hypothetical protein
MNPPLLQLAGAKHGSGHIFIQETLSRLAIRFYALADTVVITVIR